MTTDRDEVIKTMKSMDIRADMKNFRQNYHLKHKNHAMNTIKQHQMKQKNIIRY